MHSNSQSAFNWPLHGSITTEFRLKRPSVKGLQVWFNIKHFIPLSYTFLHFHSFSHRYKAERNNSMVILSFIYLKGRVKKTDKIFPLWVHSSNGLNYWLLHQAEARNSTMVSHVDDMGPSIWTIFLCLPRYINRELAQKLSSPDLNQPCSIWCKHRRWWLKPLHLQHWWPLWMQVLVPTSPLPNRVPDNDIGRAVGNGLTVWAPAPNVGETQKLLPALARPRSHHCSQLGGKPVDKRSFSVSSSLWVTLPFNPGPALWHDG